MSSVSFSSSFAFLEILLKHAAMDAHKFWLPLQMYCLSMERLQSFFPQNVATWFFPKKILCTGFFFWRCIVGNFTKKNWIETLLRSQEACLFFLAQFCDVAKVVNIQKLFFNIILAIYHIWVFFKFKKELLYSWLPTGTYYKNLVIWKIYFLEIWQIWVISFMKNPLYGLKTYFSGQNLVKTCQ